MQLTGENRPLRPGTSLLRPQHRRRRVVEHLTVEGDESQGSLPHHQRACRFTAVVLGYQLYQERQNATGIEINVGKKRSFPSRRSGSAIPE